jgi:hypothetical protein
VCSSDLVPSGGITIRDSRLNVPAVLPEMVRWPGVIFYFSYDGTLEALR